MKTAGIVGGIGPESTIDYYRQTIALYRERKPDGSYPPIIINSIDVTHVLALVGAKQLPRLIEYLLSALRQLAGAGADFGVFASNTPHMVFDEVSRQSPMPLISIVQATCGAGQDSGLKRLGLFGTRFTMQGGFYLEVFGRAGMTLVAPLEDEQTYIHDKYMNELLLGTILPETRAGLLAIVQRMTRDEHIEGLILAGTELPLILRDVPDQGIPFLDTTKIHVRSIVEEMVR